MMKRLAAFIFCLVGLWGTSVAAAQEMVSSPEGVSLTVSLRDSAGTAAAGETIILEQFPEETAVSCTTDAQGRCAWSVSPGLYQLLFTRPPDEITAVAVAEGGLRGLGITVGDLPITYHFTFHSDGRVYFDAAPDAARPQPIMPTAADLHGHGESPLPDTAVTPTSIATPVMTATPVGETTTDVTASPLFLLLAAGGGVVIALIVHRLARRPDQRAEEIR